MFRLVKNSGFPLYYFIFKNVILHLAKRIWMCVLQLFVYSILTNGPVNIVDHHTTKKGAVCGLESMNNVLQ